MGIATRCLGCWVAGLALLTPPAHVRASVTAAETVLVPAYANFVVAGLSGMSAWVVVHPADIVKTRMQLIAGRAPNATAISVGKDIVRQEGVLGLFGGLSAALARQATYTTLRLGLYDTLIHPFSGDHGGGGGWGVSPARMALLRQLVGLLSGAVASFCSCPIEVCLVRMQADGRLPPEKRRNYRGVFHALYRICRDEGPLTYWRGATTTVARAIVVSVSQVSTYDQAKALLGPGSTLNLEGIGLHLVASSIAAVVFSVVSMPLDTVKTRVQQASGRNERHLASGPAAHKNTLQALVSIARAEGVTSLWRGFRPYFVRSAAITVLLFLIKEQYHRIAREVYARGGTVAVIGAALSAIKNES